MLRRLAPIAVTALLLSPAPAGAASSILTQVQRAYGEHGQIPPCQFTSQQLESALRTVDTYGAQYFADLTAAVQSALASRATGSCAPGGARPSVPAAPLRLGSLTAATASGLPAPILLTAVPVALLTIGALAVALSRWRGWDPPWGAAWRHLWAEAGYRAQGTWLEFTDWLRSGS